MWLLRWVGLVRQVVEHVREAQQPQRLAMGAHHFFEIARHDLRCQWVHNADECRIPRALMRMTRLLRSIIF